MVFETRMRRKKEGDRGYMDHDRTGDAALDEDARDAGNDHDDDVTAGGTDLVELDPDEENTPSNMRAAKAIESPAAETPAVAQVPTLLERMASAGINNVTALQHLQRMFVCP
jgi:hypothetical protein